MTELVAAYFVVGVLSAIYLSGATRHRHGMRPLHILVPLIIVLWPLAWWEYRKL